MGSETMPDRPPSIGARAQYPTAADWETRNHGEGPMSEQEREAPFRFVVDGGRKLEDVPFREIAAMLEGFAILIARGSADILHRPMHPVAGRQEGPIEEASRIRLVSLTSGSIVAALRPAAPRVHWLPRAQGSYEPWFPSLTATT